MSATNANDSQKCKYPERLPGDYCAEDTTGIPSSSIVTVSFMDERMQYEPRFRQSSIKYKPMSTQSVAVTANGEGST